MEIGFIGLGRMGMNMVKRLHEGGHRVVAWDLDMMKTKEAAKAGAAVAASIEKLVERLIAPRAVWIMVPAGQPTQDVFARLLVLMESGDILIDGGNSHYNDSVRRYQEASGRGIRFLDAGTSGGIWGLAEGFCLMAGGDRKAFDKVEPVFKTLAPKDGYLYCGNAGSGHFVKMVHNGIEYGLLQAYAEGFELMHASQFGLDLAAVSRLWNHGSVVRSWLLELCERAFAKDASLEKIEGYIADSGEGRWTIDEAMSRNVPMPVTALSLFVRYISRQDDSFGNKLIAALRNEFGGHPIKAAPPEGKGKQA